MVYVCGDAVKGTVEGCDDGNTVPGDGCSDHCEVESGWVCTSVVNQQSSCSIPVDPTFAFTALNYGPYSEGQTATITVQRLGDDDTEVTVDWKTSDASAVSEQSLNSGAGANTLQTAGDYIAMQGTLVFAIGESQKTFDVQILEDNNWDASVNEQIALILENPVGAGIVLEFSIAYVSINDEDTWASFSPTISPTPSSTTSPTTSPTPSPTMSPTMIPTPHHCANGVIDVGESDLDCGITCGGNCGIGKVCNEDGDCSSFACVGGECVAAPTVAPTLAPTEAPTASPTSTPTGAPTIAPTGVPTPSPTIEPTALGSMMTVMVTASLTGITVEEFAGQMIERFEKDMADYYGVEEDMVLVTKVLARGDRRRLLSGGIEVDYVILTQDRSSALSLVTLVEESEAVIKDVVTTAAVEVLQKVIVVEVEVAEVELEAQTEEERSKTLMAATTLKAGDDDDEGKSIYGALVGAVGAVVVILVTIYLIRLRKNLQSRNRIYNEIQEKKKIQDEEKAKKMKEEAEELVRLEQEKMIKEMKEKEEKERDESERASAEVEKRRAQEKFLADAAARKEKFQASIKLKPKYAKLGANMGGGGGDNHLEKWLAKKHVEMEMDHDDDDDDEVLADLLAGGMGGLGTMKGPPAPTAPPMKGPPAPNF